MNEDNAIDGAINYLKEKNRHRDGFRVLHRSHAKDHDRGIDLKCAAYSNGVISNRYYVEAKGTLKVKDDSEKKSKFRRLFYEWKNYHQQLYMELQCLKMKKKNV